MMFALWRGWRHSEGASAACGSLLDANHELNGCPRLARHELALRLADAEGRVARDEAAGKHHRHLATRRARAALDEAAGLSLVLVQDIRRSDFKLAAKAEQRRCVQLAAQVPLDAEELALR